MRTVRYGAYAAFVKHALDVCSFGDASERAIDIKCVFATVAVN
jgi:hypothetical protein